MNPYAYVKQNSGISCDLKRETDRWSRYSVDFPSAQPARHLGGTQVRGEYIVPKRDGRLPLAVIVHGMGDRSVRPCRLIARTLAKKGIATFIIYLVFHSRRIPAAIKDRFPSISAEEWFESYQISVTDVRQVIDFAGTRPEIDPEKISVVGISFGGFIASIAMALDARIKAGIFIVSGGNSDKITKHSLLLRRVYKLSRAEYLSNQESYTRYLAEVEEKGFENVTPGKNSYWTDPKTFSIYLRDRPVMMLNASFDEMIPKAATLDLWEAYGKPPIKWYPATHASIWMWYPWMGPRIVSFLESVFKLAG
jgi:dienelactone hydrolase